MEATAIRPKRTRVEPLNYCKGGFHPIHLNDTFKHERYKIIHKLGHGGFATVWLARDNKRERYVAMKVLAARLSRGSPEVEILRVMRSSPEHVGKPHVMSLLDHFYHVGPNGKHLCLVSEVGGPSIKEFNECPGEYTGSRRLEASVARSVSLQAIHGLNYIHDTGIVHGDLTPANILLQLANIDEWTVEQVYERLGDPQKRQVESKSSDPSASESFFPDYMVIGIDMKDVAPNWLSDEIIIIDFGIAFLQKSSSLNIGTPKSYCAPELLFGFHRSTASDIWALGCTIFEIRTGFQLFKYKSVPKRDEMLIAMVKLLGPLPDEWWDVWEEGREWYESQSEMDERSTRSILYQILETGAHDGDSPPHHNTHKDKALSVVEGFRKALPRSSDGTDQLVAIAEGLSTIEAEEVLKMAKQHMLGKKVSGSMENIEGHGSGSFNLKDSDGKSSGTKSMEAKSSTKTPSSEGIATGGSQAKAPNRLLVMPEESESSSTVKGDVRDRLTNSAIREMSPTEVELLFGSDSAQSFLEPYGIRVSIAEANFLEDLLLKALRYLPEERVTAAELSNHIWLSDVPN